MENTEFNVVEVDMSPGINLIEASAGTGKTYSLAIMFLRWILEGNWEEHKIDSVLTVTFTEAATQELKARMLKFLKDAQVYMNGGKTGEKLVRDVCCKAVGVCGKSGVKERLRAAINDFDTASIFTIHGFCSKITKENAFELGSSFDLELSEEAARRKHELAADFYRTYVNRYAETHDISAGELPTLGILEELLGKAGLGQKSVRVEGSACDDLYNDFIRYAACEIRNRRELTGKMDFDDMILAAYEVLSNEELHDAALSLKNAMKKYRLVMIDEFQDTDPVQYFIFRELFCERNDAAVFFIGDPKQSIYSFRSADIFSYLETAAAVDRRYSMGVNFRSSGDAVDAVNMLFKSTDDPFKAEQIRYSDVRSVKNDLHVEKDGIELPGIVYKRLDSVKKIKKDDVQEALYNDICSTIVEMLKKDSPYRLCRPEKTALKPSDIAVLVARNEEAAEIGRRLRSKNIPAVVEGRDSVFGSDEAMDLLILMNAVRKQGMAEFNALQLSVFCGKKVQDLALADDESRKRLGNLLSCFSKWEEKGFYYCLSEFTGKEETIRSLASAGVEAMNNIRHLSELINNYESVSGYSVNDTFEWFEKMIRESKDSRSGEDVNSRQCNDDENVVKILTVHKSKGLEFGIVFFAFIDGNLFDLYSSGKKPNWSVRHVQDENGRFRKVISFEKDNPDAERENISEKMREIYVGVTRAKYLTVCYSSRENYFQNAENHTKGPAERLALGGNKCDDTLPVPEKSLELRRPLQLTENIRPAWSVSSFSGIIANRGGNSAAADEDNDENTSGQEDPSDTRAKSQNDKKAPDMLDFQKGPDAGTALHAIFEKADFSSDDNTEIIGEELKIKLNMDGDDLRKMTAAVNSCVNEVRSAPIFEGKSLKDVSPKHKCAETEFFLNCTKEVSPRRLSDIIKKYNYEMEDLTGDSLKGFLTGSIDLALKIDGKYYIIDWKSNYLGDCAEKYSQKNIKEEMKKHRYYLQYLLYLTAFDRYLSSVDSSYSYAKDFGGIRYVFLRGVRQDDPDSGIFKDLPDEKLLRKIQKLFGAEVKK